MVTGGRDDTDFLSSTESYIVGQSISWKIEPTLNLPTATRHLYGVSFLNTIIMTGRTFNQITLRYFLPRAVICLVLSLFP